MWDRGGANGWRNAIWGPVAQPALGYEVGCTKGGGRMVGADGCWDTMSVPGSNKVRVSD